MNQDRQVQWTVGRVTVAAVAGERAVVELFPPNDGTLCIDRLLPDVAAFHLFGSTTSITTGSTEIALPCINPPGIILVGASGTTAGAVPTGAAAGPTAFEAGIFAHSIVITSMYPQRLRIFGSVVNTALNVDLRMRLFPQDYRLDEIMALM